MLPTIKKLTSEQEAMIPAYREKWQGIAISTELIDREKAAEAVKAAYKLIGEQEPEIVFCSSPNSALNLITTGKFQLHLGRRIEKKLRKPLQEQLESQIDGQLMEELSFKLNPYHPLEGQLKGLIDEQLQFRKLISIGYWLNVGSVSDFSSSVLNCVCEREKKETIHSILRSCGWILPYVKKCLICERPIKLSFDSQKDWVHAEGKPAIQFADGFSIYVDRGKRLEIG